MSQHQLCIIQQSNCANDTQIHGLKIFSGSKVAIQSGFGLNMIFIQRVCVFYLPALAKYIPVINLFLFLARQSKNMEKFSHGPNREKIFLDKTKVTNVIYDNKETHTKA